MPPRKKITDKGEVAALVKMKKEDPILCDMQSKLPAREQAFIALAGTLGGCLVAITALVLIFGGPEKAGIIGSSAWALSAFGIFLAFFMRK